MRIERFVLLAVMSLAAVSAVGQHKYYYTLAECGNDPLKYIEMNYEDNAIRYNYSINHAFLGKYMTMAEFVQECELELKYFVPDIYYRAEGGGNSTMFDKVIGIWLYFYYDDYQYIVPIWFMPPFTYTVDDFDNLEDNEYREVWNDLYYQFFKDYNIYYMGTVLKRHNGQSLKNYRRP